VKQIVQNLKSGVLETLDVPCPQVARGHLLIQSRASLISSGTERSLVEFGRANLLSKARQQPERVKQVWEKIKTDGLWSTMEAVFSRLDEPMPLGYCNSGTVMEVGPGVSGFSAGDRVVSNGGHAEIVHRPVNLCAKIPAEVSDEQAAFAVLGAIGLQGIRLLQPALGESVAVFGLGLIGLLSVQMLAASGARVLGIDPDPRRLELAREFGATTVDLSAGADPVEAGLAFSGGHGVDGVLITASAKSDEIVSQSARMARKRGRIVLVGVVDLELNRSEFYQKELTFQVSCSYGPGRYDSRYEEQGIDYPYDFVRWTEQRNIEAVLEMLASGRLAVDRLITARLPHAEAARAYELLTGDRSQLGIVLSYPESPAVDRTVAANGRVVNAEVAAAARGASLAEAGPRETSGVQVARVGVIGAGAFSTRVLIPALKRTGAELVSVASAGGLSSAHAARKFGFARSTSDYQTVLADGEINAVMIATRPNTHAGMVAEALRAGKHVFVEKPLAIDRGGLEQVRRAYEESSGRQLLVGFNRRFSPHALEMKKLLGGRSGPLAMTMLVNAGKIAADHWIRDAAVNGGRIIGEACHWFDLMVFLSGSRIVAVQSSAMGSDNGDPAGTVADNVTINLSFADGSIGTVHYFANGHRSFAKERLSVFCEGRVLELDNFRRLYGYGWRRFSKHRLLRQDKGHVAEVKAFIERVTTGGPPLIPFAELANATEATFAAVESITSGQPVQID
jgi:predicted dehydrogenase